MHTARFVPPILRAAALLWLVATPGSAQSSLAFATLPGSSVAAYSLKNQYRVRLVSAWPVYPGETASCNNNGDEVLEGTIALAESGSLSGKLTRTTTLRFCGAHGADAVAGESCSLTLTGSGTVDVEGGVATDPVTRNGAEATLVWRAADGGTVQVTGTCPPRFQEALALMYRTAAHRVELTLPPAGAGKARQALEDYGWVAEID